MAMSVNATLRMTMTALAVCASLLTTQLAHAADAPKLDPAHLKFFESKVRPLLSNKCFKCHGEDKHKADLRVDSLAGLIHGGKSGPAIEPGQPDKSLLITAIRYDEPDLEMPPKITTPTLSLSKLSAMPLMPPSNSTISPAWTLSRP